MGLAGPTGDIPTARAPDLRHPPFARRSIASPNRRFGTEIFRKLDRLG